MKTKLLLTKLRTGSFSHKKLNSINRIIFNNYSSKSRNSELWNYVAVNEPILDYAKNSKERDDLQKTLNLFLNSSTTRDQREALFDVPIVIGDKEIRTNNVRYQLLPFDHNTRLARFYHADKKLLNEAIENSLLTRPAWENSSFDFRANILLKAADKLATIKRADILAATMLGQAKTIYQAGNYKQFSIKKS
jgi:1-pyrroline-5-carboxylate dehydrogenase